MLANWIGICYNQDVVLVKFPQQRFDNDLVLDRTLTIKAENLIWKIGNPYNADERYIGTINNNILKPLYMYIRGADPYSIVCF